MSDQDVKFERLKALHGGDKAFVIPNPWDAGSARLLASLGFEALATTSAGYAFSKGKRDFPQGSGALCATSRRLSRLTSPRSVDRE